MPRSRTRLARVLLAASLLGAPGCSSVRSLVEVQPPEDGVNVKELTADLAFGAEAPPPAPPQAPSTGAQAIVELVAPLVLFDDDAGAFPPPPRPPAPGQPACPEADQSDVAAEESTPVVKGVPVPGVYRWKQEGTVTIPGLATLPLPALSTRTFRNVAAADGATAYEYEQQSLAGSETQFISVRADGVYLTRLLIESGSETIDFNPLLPLKLYSLPISPGEAIAEQAVDVADRLVVSVNGQVGTRERLDACGELLDAWLFEGTRTIEVLGDPSSGIRSTRYDTWLAPQYGGIFVGDRVTTQAAIGSLVYTVEATTNIGGLRPVRPA